jgi:hypothetical protein
MRAKQLRLGCHSTYTYQSVVNVFTGNEGDHDQGQKTEGTAHHVGVRTLGLLEGFGDTSISSFAHAFY